MFGIPTMYGGFASKDLYNNGAACGICNELVGPDNVFILWWIIYALNAIIV